MARRRRWLVNTGMKARPTTSDVTHDAMVHFRAILSCDSEAGGVASPERVASRAGETTISHPAGTARMWLTVGALAFTLLGASTIGSAAAEVPYVVKIAVPAAVKDPSKFTIRVFGHSANLTRLSAFIDTEACATTAAV